VHVWIPLIFYEYVDSWYLYRFNREIGENPLQPPLLLTVTNPVPLDILGRKEEIEP
jgi:hypothetical protein